ncbi:MAG: hypothetical protein Q8O75_02450, partial [bacterium]|nr:hypothetical protein [bacterium]
IKADLAFIEYIGELAGLSLVSETIKLIEKLSLEQRKSVVEFYEICQQNYAPGTMEKIESVEKMLQEAVRKL